MALTAQLYAVEELDHRSVRVPSAAGELIGRADAVNAHHTGKNLELA